MLLTLSGVNTFTGPVPASAVNIDAGTLAFSSAPLMAMAPRSLPEKSLSEPLNLPTGVRAPATITDVVISYLQMRGCEPCGRFNIFKRLRKGYRG